MENVNSVTISAKQIREEYKKVLIILYQDNRNCVNYQKKNVLFDYLDSLQFASFSSIKNC